MKNLIFAIGIIFILLSCSSTNKSIQQPGIKNIKRATVQEHFPGVENGDITYKLVFEFDLGKDVKIHKVKFNGKIANLQPFKNETTFRGTVAFSPTEINNFKEAEFKKTEAVIIYSLPGVDEVTEVVRNITVLESVYMP